MGWGYHVVLVREEEGGFTRQDIVDSDNSLTAECLPSIATRDGGGDVVIATPILVGSGCGLSFACDSCGRGGCPGCKMPFVLSYLDAEEAVTCMACLGKGSLQQYLCDLHTNGG